MIKFYDDFLSKEDYEKLYNLLVKGDNDFPWYYTNNIAVKNEAADNNLFYLVHLFYNNNKPLSRHYDNFIEPFLIKLKAKTLIRAKANLFPGQNKLTQIESHIDYDYKHKAAVYCLNSCDGYTAIKQDKKWKKINSVANRLIVFDGNIEHASTNCTNEPARVNINFNYL